MNLAAFRQGSQQRAIQYAWRSTGKQLAISSGSNPENASRNGSVVTKKSRKKDSICADIIMLRGLIEIDRMAASVNLSKTIVNKGRDLYRKALDSKQFEANTNEGVASACLYIAARLEKSPLSFKNVCHASKSGKRSIRKCFDRILKIFNIQLEPDIYTDPFVNSLCNDLDLPHYVVRMTHHIIMEAEAMKIVSQCGRQAIIAAAIFMATQVTADKRSQEDVENISGVAGEAIWEAYRLMYPHASELISIHFELSAPIQSLPKI